MQNLKGRLTGQGELKVYNGYYVQVFYDEAVRINKKDRDPHWKATVLREEVSENGEFSITIPDKAEISDQIKIRIIAPDGEVLSHTEHRVAGLEKEIKFEVAPKKTYAIKPLDDPFLGKRTKISGRVLDLAGKRKASFKQLFLWARPENSEKNEFTMVMFAQTDKMGYFSGLYPRGTFIEAYGVVGIEGAQKKIPIKLENNSFPRNIILAVEIPEDEEAEGQPECGQSLVPRNPDNDDLTNAPCTYSSDAGAGKCVEFTVPNRTLEEFSYYSIMRTTDPEIKGSFKHKKDFLSVEELREIMETLAGVFPGSTTSMNPYSLTVTNMKENSSPAALEISKKIFPVDPQILKKYIEAKEDISSEILANAGIATVKDNLLDIINQITKKVHGREIISAANSIDWDDKPELYQAATVAHGHILHFKQVWKADGYSLGDLLYSLPLAPCQKKQIAIVDWDRREIAARTETLEEEEAINALLSRDRDISEIVYSSLEEHVRGGSKAGVKAGGGGLGLALGPVVIGAAGGASSSSSSAWQDSSRSIAANSLQQLRDSTMQAASAVRSQRATVVNTVRQGESMRVQTEIVANYNHCHAMTIEYFEVLRHFQVSQELTDVQECLFIPLMMSGFDYEKALRWRIPLKRSLRDYTLRGGFDAVERIKNGYAGSDLPEGRYCQENIEYLDGELRISFQLERPKDKDDGSFEELSWTNYLPFLWGSPFSIYNQYLSGRIQEERDRVFRTEIAPRIAEEFVQKLKFYLIAGTTKYEVNLDPTLVSSYQPNVPLYISLSPLDNPPSIFRESVTRFEIVTDHELPLYSKVIVHSGTVRYRTKHLSHRLFSSSFVKNDLIPGDPVQIPTSLDSVELRNPKEQDKEAVKKLIAHLNENIEYYHKVIWFNMDKDRRYMLLDGFEINITGTNKRRSIASVVENRLIGIVGNNLVMPVARGFHLDPTYSQNAEKPVDLLNLYAPNTPIPPMRISVPTKGVFAEAVLGSCNSCEIKDDTRFWRFEESPITDQLPGILPTSTDSRRVEPEDTNPTSFPAPIINLQNAPAAPDPTGLSEALKLLGTPNIFKDITGLEQNQKNALAAFQSVMENSRFFGGEAAKLAQQKALSKDIDRAMQKISEAQKKGLISEEQASSLTESALRGLLSDERRPKQNLTDEEEVKGLIRKSSDRDSADVSVSRDGESVEVKSISDVLGNLLGERSTPNKRQRPDRAVDLPLAVTLINQFKNKAGGGAWHNLSRVDVANRLIDLVTDQNKIYQGANGLCGPAAFFNVWIEADPLSFTKFSLDIYEKGEARINTLNVKADSDLRNQDYTKIVPQMGSFVVPAADWMVMSALRDSENWLLDYEGTPSESWSDPTTSSEVRNWLRATGLFSSVRDETNSLSTKGLAHAKSLNPTQNRKIIMRIDVNMIDGRPKSNPNHFIVLHSRITEDASGNIDFKYWTWGEPPKNVAQPLTKDRFEADYYGAIMAEY